MRGPACNSRESHVNDYFIGLLRWPRFALYVYIFIYLLYRFDYAQGACF
jgi:hypothetical protein